MINIFMRSPLPNSLAAVVFMALVLSWFASLILIAMDVPVPIDKGWYIELLSATSLLGILATLDLVQAHGIAVAFASIVFIVLVLNMTVPILKISGKSSHTIVQDWHKWSAPVSAVGGLVISGYLTFIESTNAQIACGPSGGCDAVQNSRYAILFGVLPISVFGLAGYIAILAGWLAWQFGPKKTTRMAALAIWAMCFFGVLFSAYLTFLEPFVIGATCMWCVSSAVLMTILLWSSTPAAQKAFATEE